MAVAASRQLAFPLSFSTSFARDDFLVASCNAQAFAAIERWPDWPSHTMALAGPPGSGKSHLASIWAESAGARFIAGRSLDVAAVPSALATGALVVEAEPREIDQGALFHLLNLAREESAFVLLTSRDATATWSMALPGFLPDLASRLRALPCAMLGAPDDELLRAVIVKLFADRQIVADDALVTYLMARIERSVESAQAAVATLDREGLRLRRPVNRALAADVLRDGAVPASADSTP